MISSRLPNGTICPVCNQSEAVYYVSPDFRSGTEIPCCNACSEILIQGQRYDYYQNAPKKWLAENKAKIDSAFAELHREYERLAALKAKGK